MHATTTAVTGEVERALARLDLATLEREYRDQDEFVYLPRFLPGSALAPLLEDAERLESRLHRSYVPRHKKGGSVSHFAIAEAGLALRRWSSTATASTTP
jgi:hypothetical protein